MGEVEIRVPWLPKAKSVLRQQRTFTLAREADIEELNHSGSLRPKIRGEEGRPQRAGRKNNIGTL